MAKPRVFISSTYYDLKSIRSDLEYFIKDMGFDPILHERGSVTYVHTASLEDSCYKEIDSCDILISIVGGRFGSSSTASEYSVSQQELKVAYDLNKAVYIFVERSVLSEYKTYEKNRTKEVNWTSVDNVKVFQFIDEVYKLPMNNPVHPFDTSFHITEFLKAQWAGLFQRLLLASSISKHTSMFLEIRNLLESARALSDTVAAKADTNDAIVSELILTSHPLLSALRQRLNVSYRFIAHDLTELEQWLSARGYKRQDLFGPEDNFYQYINDDKKLNHYYILDISTSLFDDDGNIKPVSLNSWNDEHVTFRVHQRQGKRPGAFDDDLDDDVPF